MSSSPLSDPHDEDLVPVKLPSGGIFLVYGREVKYFQERVKRYLEDNHFTNVADLQELDRIVSMETMMWRWSIWVSQQKDYWFDPIDEKELQKQNKETSTEVRGIKGALGIDKVTRDKVRGEDSVSKYLENLRIRAREFGVHREGQLSKALELFNELDAKVTLFDNCTEDERRETGATLEGVMAWIRDDVIPRYRELDEYFRKNTQRFWIRDM